MQGGKKSEKVDRINFFNPVLQQMVFQCYNPSVSGPLSGLRVSTPYTSKDHLQHKRYSAQSMGTTYAYDFLELFRQVSGWMVLI